MSKPFLAAAAQVAPALLDLDRSLDIACEWIRQAARDGVRLLVFPESWLPGYPFWLDVSPEAGLWDHAPAKAVFRRLFENSPSIPSPATDRLAAAAAEADIALVMGLHERDGNTLYNSIVYFSPHGALLGKHRKLVPTYTERLVWGQGDGSTLVAPDTSFGPLGGLICWEHWMPLARQAMHERREVVHAALWPWVKELNLLASRAYAFEGRCYVIAAGAILGRQHLPAGLPLLDAIPNDGPWLRGGSTIIAPDGTLLAGPASDDERLVVAEIDPARIAEEAMALDVCGHYARPDVFEFRVREAPSR